MDLGNLGSSSRDSVWVGSRSQGIDEKVGLGNLVGKGLRQCSDNFRIVQIRIFCSQINASFRWKRWMSIRIELG